MCHFKTDDGGGFWDHRRDWLPKFGYFPLAVAEIEEALSQDVVALDLEGPDESIIGAHDAEIVIQNDNRLGHRIDDTLSLYLSAFQQAVKVFQDHLRPVP